MESTSVTSRVELEFYISWTRDNGELFAKRYAAFYEEYSTAYTITVRAEPYRLTLVATIKQEETKL